MTTYRPPKKTKILWALRSLCLMLLLCLISGWFLFLSVKIVLAVIASVSVVLILFNTLYLPAYIDSYSVRVGKNAVIITSGVFIKKERIMPQKRLIYTERLTSPIAFLLSLSALTLRAARTMTLTIELDKNDIEQIIKEVQG